MNLFVPDGVDKAYQWFRILDSKTVCGSAVHVVDDFCVVLNVVVARYAFTKKYGGGGGRDVMIMDE